jgi:DNA-directed RNA polymerase subunit K/omega
MDGDYDYEEVVELATKSDNNHTFMKQYDKNLKQNSTMPILTNYEKTRILSERSSQISDGAQPLVANVERYGNAYEIAVEELKQGTLPFIICRPKGVGMEYFKLKDLSF